MRIPAGHPSIIIRKQAYEQSGLTRYWFDERLGLTDEEFRVEGQLLCIGPVYEEDEFQTLIAELEGAGLVYFADFFDLSGNWPDWLEVYLSGAKTV